VPAAKHTGERAAIRYAARPLIGGAPSCEWEYSMENKELLRPSTSLMVVTNFFDGLRRRVPAGHGKQ
jgi:hypothetical protein